MNGQATTSRRRSRFALGLALICLLGFGIRIGFIVSERDSKLGGDAIYYHKAANLLADGKGFIDPFRYLYGSEETITLANGETKTITIPIGHVEPTAGHPPVYVLYLAAFSELGMRSATSHKVASALLGLAAIVLAGLLGRELRSDRLGLIAAFLTAVYANVWVNDIVLMSETAAIVMAFASTWFGLRFWRSPTLRNGVWFAVAGALAALSRAELLLFMPIIGAVALLRAHLPWSRRFGTYAVMGAVCLAALAPWVIRNNLVMKESLTLSDGAGTVLVQANCDLTYYGDENGDHIGGWYLYCGSRTQPYGPNGELLDESERDKVVREQALAYIRSHTTRLITVVVPARVGRMWGVYQPIDQMRTEIVERRPAVPAWIGFWQYVVLMPFVFAGVVVQWRRREPVLVLLLWVGLVTFTAATTFGNIRYRTAAEISIVMFAAISFDAIWSMLERRRGDTSDAGRSDSVPDLPTGVLDEVRD
ncbi:MAG: hypothetical protein F2520_12000 [Actinobacteria bacterium]|uniref:Unannotated protein n=1 Tax=freshwater metagenome TaxID=449393 RepID=A0A6J5YLU3_9ZZZZ|nr:hypothetical protein [Actinomycetota bacterium]MTA78972.1 hypothetical protein [Actinomycetota bacterium]